jgi:hypothetical protein
MQKDVRRLLPSLSRSQANVLGELVFAMLMVDGCGMTRICSYLSALLEQAMNTLRQKYREIYYEKEAKAGVKKGRCKRRELVVEELFADLLRGILRDWQGPKTLVLALDASTLSDRLTVLSISVMYRGCGIRVAWTILPGAGEGSWRPHWERMLRLLAQAVPAEWQVLVMADRGLYAAWLFQAIQAQGWHPFLRVKQALSFQAEGESTFRPIGTRVKRVGREWKGPGSWSEKGKQMQGTGWVRWEGGYEEPICVVSDLPTNEAKTAWYQLRFWIEDEYKDGKRGWFHWEHSKMTEPERAGRLWLVLAIAMQKAVLVGGELEAHEQEAQRKKRRSGHGKQRRRGRPAVSPQRPRGREQSVLMRGVMAMRARETGGQKSLPPGRVRTEPLPRRLYAVKRVPRSYQLKQQRRAHKKRQRQRAESERKRTERAQARAAYQAAVQARRQERQARRQAKEAEQQARQQEQQGRRLARPVRRQADGAATRATHQAASSGAQRPGATSENTVLGSTKLQTSDGHLSRCDREQPKACGPGSVRAPVSDLLPTGGPLLRLYRGRLQPPHKPMRTEIQHQRAHEPP